MDNLTLEQALNRVNATTVQKAVFDDFLGRVEAHVVTLMLAMEGWKSNPQPIFAEAVYLTGNDVLAAIVEQRRSISTCRIVAAAPSGTQ
jgi:hypothetical protein